MVKFREMEAIDDGWSEWVEPVQGYKMACCDCGLVHEMEFRILQVTDQNNFIANILPWGRYRLSMRAKRNNRSTAQIRRWM